MSSFHRIFSFKKQVLVIISIALGLSSCYNEPDTLGGNLIPSGDKTSIQVDSTFDVAAYTVSTDTLPSQTYGTYNLLTYYSQAVLGSINTEIFGSVKGDFLTRVQIAKLSDTLKLISPRPAVDSLLLTFVRAKAWGNITNPINVKVYELTDSIESELNYNCLAPNNIAYNPTPINYPVTYSGDSSLTIRLKEDFAYKLMNAPDSVFESNYRFMNFMKGLYITCDDFSGKGGSLYYLSSVMKMVMYYKKPKLNNVQKDTVFTYYLGTQQRLNHITHDYSKVNSALKITARKVSEINENTPEDTIFYVDGLGGMRGLLKFKDLQAWSNKMPVAIHRAELRIDVLNHPDFPVDSIINPIYLYSKRYYRIDDVSYTEITTPIDDAMYTGTSLTSAKYNKVKKYYSIDITAHLQNLIRGKHSNDYIFFDVAPSYSSLFYHQGLFRTGNSSKPIKLIITYSKL